MDPAYAPAAVRLCCRQGGVLLILLAAFVLLAIGCLRWEWGLLELSGLFIAVGLLGGLVGGLGADGTAEEFLKGAAGFAGAALVVGGCGVLAIFDAARVTDGILHAMAETVRGLPQGATVAGIYVVQIVRPGSRRRGAARRRCRCRS